MKPVVIRELSISGFKGFEDCHLSDLGGVNIIVGDNGTGKTSFLEAILLVSGSNPATPIYIRDLRTRTLASARSDPPYENAAYEMFHNFSGDIRITCTGSDDCERSLTMSLDSNFSRLLLYNAGPNRYLPFDIEWTGPEGKKQYKPVVMNGVIALREIRKSGPVHIESGYPDALNSVLMNNSQATNELPSIFHDLNSSGMLPPVLKRIYGQFPDITEIFHGQEVDRTPALFGRLKNSKIGLPLDAISAGMASIIRINVLLEWSGKSIFMIDEIENGIYYLRFPALWKSLFEYVRDRGHQLFITTHSIECVRAAAEVAKKFGDCTMIRTAKENGRLVLRHFQCREFVKEVLSGSEPR